MSDEKTGLSSYGQQRFDDLELTVKAMAALLFEDDVDRLHRERDRIAGIMRQEAAPPPPPVQKEDLDALMRQFRDLQNRLDYHAVHNRPPEPVGPAEPPLPPPPEPPPGDRLVRPEPFEGQRPMVPFGGPEAGRSWEQGPRPPESPPAPPPGAWQPPPPPPPQAPPPDVPPQQHAGGGWGPR